MSDNGLTLGRNDIEDILWGNGELVEKSFSRTTRWEIWYWVIFRRDEALWRVEWNEGATEMQETGWPEVFEAQQVEAVSVEHIEYRPLGEEE